MADAKDGNTGYPILLGAPVLIAGFKDWDATTVTYRYFLKDVNTANERRPICSRMARSP